MSNKKETPVSWLVQRIVDRQNGVINEFPIYSLDQIFDHALEMESQKQQKYDEMLGMLEAMYDEWCEVGIGDSHMSYYMNSVKQLIKEAKEL
jgi:hypothetical protein